MSKRMLVWGVFGSVLIALGCSGSGGSADAGNQGTGGSGTGGSGTGGSGTGGASSIDPTAFLGTWTETATVSGSGSCASSITPVTATGQIVVNVGTASDLVRTESSANSCSIPLNIVSSSEATLARASQCFESLGTYDFSTWTMTVSGSTGTESASGMLTLTGVGTCPITLTATLTR